MTLQDTITRPEIRSLGDYDVPSRSRQELYGDDILLNVWWRDNPWYCSAACYRVPLAMTWGDFWAGLFVPYHEEDPDFDASLGWEQFEWTLGGAPVTPTADATIEGLGLTHKAVLGFRAHP